MLDVVERDLIAITSLNSTVLDTVEWKGCIHLFEALSACMFMTRKKLFPI